MIVKLALGVVGVIFFLFIFWKRLKEDYSSDIIFQTASTILIGMGLGILVSRLFLPMWFFWISFAGSLLGMFLMIIKFKLRVYEVFESFTLAAMPFVSLMFFRDSIVNSSLNSFLAFVASLVLIFLAYYIDLNYRSFSWYKSGKIGFTGLFIATVFFLIRSIIAIVGLNMVSCVGKFDILISGILVLVFTVFLINLGRKRE